MAPTLKLVDPPNDPALEEIKFNGDAKNRLPADFIQAAAEAIACEKIGIENIHDITGSYNKKQRITAELATQIHELTTAFEEASLITCDDSKKDPQNGGQLLRISIDLDKTALDDKQKLTAQKAIRKKVAWMGYIPFGETPHDDFINARQGVIKMTYPAYNPQR